MTVSKVAGNKKG